MSEEKKFIRFMSVRKLAAVVSALAVVASILILSVKGLNFGLDFTGGTLIEVIYEESPVLQEVRDSLADEGFENAIVVNFGADTDVLVRLPQGLSPELGLSLIHI